MTESMNPQPGSATDRFNGFLIGIVFILTGAFIFADQHDYLEASWFWWLIFSVGVIFLIESIVRLALPRFRRLTWSRLIWGPILIAIGGSKIVYLENWWPVIFILTGILLIINALREFKR